jgi:hypothetical protein
MRRKERRGPGIVIVTEDASEASLEDCAALQALPGKQE